VSFSFNIGVVIERNLKSADLIADSSVTMSYYSNGVLKTVSYFPSQNLKLKYYSKWSVYVNEKLFPLPLTFSSKMGLISVGAVKYRNNIVVVGNDKNFFIANSLDSEDYLADVMTNFPQNLELQTYEALAVALRSFLFALKNLYKNDKYFITSNNKYFPYKGYSNPDKKILYALQATKDEVLFYKNNPVYAYYSYDCGGITASAEEIFGYKVGYLQSVPSPFGSDDSKYAQWTYYYTYSTLTKIFSHFIKGKVTKIYILSRTKSGRVGILYIRTTYASYKIKGEDIYEWVPRNILPSLVFSVYRYKDGYKFVGKGYGSGLGLPIYDANSFAQRGYSYKDILNHFYPNTTLELLK
jgi:stage II sporulation protein D